MSLSSPNGNIYPLSKRHGHCFLFNLQTYMNGGRKSGNFAILLLRPRRFKFSWFIIAMALLSAARILDYVCHECLLLEVNQLLSKSHLSSSSLLFYLPTPPLPSSHSLSHPSSLVYFLLKSSYILYFSWVQKNLFPISWPLFAFSAVAVFSCFLGHLFSPTFDFPIFYRKSPNF